MFGGIPKIISNYIPYRTYNIYKNKNLTVNPTKLYKSVNIKRDAFDRLTHLAQLLSTPYARVTLGSLVSQLVHEKLNTLTLKK